MRPYVEGLAPLLYVFDMPASLRFYCQVLRFEVKKAAGANVPENDWALLELDGIQLMLNTMYEPGERPPQFDPIRKKAHEDVCLYFACPDVDGLFRLLREQGVEVAPPEIAFYGMKQLYVFDPDGYSLCFQYGIKKLAGRSGPSIAESMRMKEPCD